MKGIYCFPVLVSLSVCSFMIPVSAQAQSADPTAGAAQSSDTSRTLLRHGDVQNIGNRNITGRIMGVLPNQFSMEKEVELGKQSAAEFEGAVRIFKDAVITEYINRLGQNLVGHSDAKTPFNFKVVDASDADVYVFPGGFIYVFKGLILEADNESELAAVMAHAIAHVCARHLTRLRSTGQYLQLFASPAVPAGEPSAQNGVRNALGLSVNLELLGKVRGFEREADQLGIQYLWNTGYDPHAFASYLEKTEAKEKNYPGSVAFFSTHPSPADRMAQCLEEEQALPKKHSYITNSPEYDRIKAALLALDKGGK